MGGVGGRMGGRRGQVKKDPTLDSNTLGQPRKSQKPRRKKWALGLRVTRGPYTALG